MDKVGHVRRLGRERGPDRWALTPPVGERRPGPTVKLKRILVNTLSFNQKRISSNTFSIFQPRDLLERIFLQIGP